jgi:predicted DNA-binding protein (MmcQ/YjbR family)
MKRAMTATDEKLLTRVRKICLSIDGVLETLSHGEPTWWTKKGGRTFATFDHHHHGAAHVGVVVAATLEVQHGLVTSQPEHFLVPPYVGSKGWVTCVLSGKPDWRQVEALVRQAHAFINTPRLRRG